MQRIEIEKTIKEFEKSYENTDFSGHNEVQLNDVFAKILEQKFKGRFLAPNNLEANKFEIARVWYDIPTMKFAVKGTMFHEDKEVTYTFNAEQITELLYSKQTETYRGPFAFCKGGKL